MERNSITRYNYVSYGNQEEHPPGGIFASVRQKFAGFGDPDFPRMIAEIRDFRNIYVAHQEKELTDREKAQAALKRWVAGLLQIYRFHHGTTAVAKK